MCVVYDGNGTAPASLRQKAWAWLGLGGSSRDALRRYLASLPGSDLPGIELHVLPELRCVGIATAAQWGARESVRAFCPDSDLTGAVINAYAARDAKCLPMNDLIGTLRPILDSCATRP